MRAAAIRRVLIVRHGNTNKAEVDAALEAAAEAQRGRVAAESSAGNLATFHKQNKLELVSLREMEVQLRGVRLLACAFDKMTQSGDRRRQLTATAAVALNRP